MSEARNVEDLFEFYRRHGDVRALARVFDRCAPELARVALHLAPDAATADDLVQSTFLTAIEEPQRFQSGRRFLPWLLGILANLAKKHADDQRRRPDPERVLRRPAAAEPAALAGGRELEALLYQKANSLPEPYREVLLLHLRHGLAAVEIGDALRRSPATVRSQVARGMRMLRDALPAGLAGALLASWARPGLAQIRRTVLARAAAHTAVVSGPGAWLAGVLTMKKKILAAAAVAAFLVGGSMWLAHDVPPVASADDASASLSARSSDPPPGERPPERDGEAADTTVRREILAEVVEKVARRGTVRARLRWVDTGHPAVGVPAQLLGWGEPNPHVAHNVRLSDADGEIVWANVAPGKVTLYGYTNASQRAVVQPGVETLVEMDLPRGTDVSGRVVDSGGRPVPFAEIWLSDSGNNRDEGVIISRADGAGRFELIGVHRICYLGARKSGYRPSNVRMVLFHPESEQGDKRVVTLVLPGPGCQLRGQVVDAHGRPAAGAVVRIALVGSERINHFDWPPSPHWVRTDAAGAFAVDGLPDGKLAVEARTRTTAGTGQEIELQPGAIASVRLELQPSITVMGRITDGAGRGLADVRVEAGEHGFLGYAAVSTDATGSYSLPGVRAGDRLRAERSDGRRASTIVGVAAGATMHWNPVLAAGRELRGRIVDSRDRPLARWQVWSIAENGQRGAARTDDEGRFAIARRVDGTHTLELRPAGKFLLHPVWVERGVRPGEREIVVRVPRDRLQLGGVVCRVAGPAGEALRDASIVVKHLPHGRIPRSVDFDEATGEYRLDGLPPVRFRAEVHRAGYPPLRLDDFEVKPGAVTDLGVIRLVAGHPCRVAVRRTDQVPAEVDQAFLRDGKNRFPLEWKDGGSDLSGLAPEGAYTLRVEGRNFVAAERHVVVAAGLDLDLLVEPGVVQQIDLAVEASASAEQAVTLELQRPDGRTVIRRTRRLRDGKARWTIGLARGAYVLSACGTEGDAAHVEFDAGAALRVRLMR